MHASLLKARHLERERYRNTLEYNMKTILLRYLTNTIFPGDEFCTNTTAAPELSHTLKPPLQYLQFLSAQ